MIRSNEGHVSYQAWSEETGSGAGKRTKISHNSSASLSSWDIDGGLAADFDGSLSGLGTELGTSSYNMSEALLALPVFKQENLDNGVLDTCLDLLSGKFQYILGAATSPAVKLNEETLTYLNQGQSYEIKLKKLGDLSEFQGKYLRSVVKILFHERRLQYMEREQLEQWRMTRPGERILDIDIPLSYGMMDVHLDAVKLNQVEFVWNPAKETGVYVRIHCISTEFTAKKHGGEKGVPFRLQVESYTHGDGEPKCIHSASCQIKVFKPKGADRKHKTDREKMERRSDVEKEKYQPSYECTVLTEVPLDQVVGNVSPLGFKSPALTNSFSELSCRSPGSEPSTSTPVPSSASVADQNNSSNHSETSPNYNMVERYFDSECSGDTIRKPLTADATAAQVTQWLQTNRFTQYGRVFQNFCGSDLLRLTREDLIQICGLADGIRLNNILQARCIRPRLTLYVCQEPESVYHAMYLDHLTCSELTAKLANLFGVLPSQIGDTFCQGPNGIHVFVSDEVIQNMPDHSRFSVDGMKADDQGDKYKILLKSMDNKENSY